MCSLGAGWSAQYGLPESALRRGPDAPPSDGDTSPGRRLCLAAPEAAASQRVVVDALLLRDGQGRVRLRFETPYRR
jgi:hypothetical protein